MTRHKHQLYIVVCSIYMMLQAVLCFAQDYDYIQYTTKDGLPTNYVYGAIEDDDGYMWIYTENGISKFDGYTFKNYGIAEGLPDNDIVYALKDKYGRIWLQTVGNHPVYLQGDSIISIESEISSHAFFDNGVVRYSCHSGKICSFHDDSSDIFNDCDIDSFILKKYEGEIPWDTTVSLESMSDTFINQNQFSDRIYTEKNCRLVSFLDSNLLLYPTDPGYLYADGQSEWVYLRHKDQLDSIKFPEMVLNGGLYGIKGILNLNSPYQFLVHLHPSTYVLVDFYSSKLTRIDLSEHVHSDRGLVTISILDNTFFAHGQKANSSIVEYDFEGNIINKYSCNSLINDYYILRPYRDSRGNLWIGSREGGLFFIPASKFKTQLISSKNQKDCVFERIIETNEGELNAITENTGIYKLNENKMQEIYPPDPELRHRSSLNTSRGVFISNSTELSLWRNNRMQHVSILRFGPDKTYGANYTSMSYDEQNDMLQGVLGTTLHEQKKSKNGSWSHSILSTRKIYFTCRNNTSNDLFISSDQGVHLNNPNSQPLKNTSDFGVVSCMYSSGDELWVGSKASGLFHYNVQTNIATRVSSANWIRSIQPDTDSTILVSTYDGLQIVPKSVHSDRPTIVYDIRDGLSTNEIQDAFYDGDKCIYVATSNGLHKIDRTVKQDIRVEQNDLAINRVEVLNIPIEIREEIKLSYEENDIEFFYHFLSYASNGKITYYTRLLPLEKVWQTSHERKSTYVALSPGEYTFELKAEDIYGNIVQHDPLTFIIKKAFWQTAGFKILTFLLTLSIVVFIVKRRERIIRAHHQTEKRLNGRIAELELMALKAQMNPHFIFNALGAIQYYIQVNDVDKADDYLTKFALLMRKYLDGSKKKFTSLKEEIELLDIYLKLERLRFEDKFNFSINVESHIYLEETYIPSMLIQPFVENSINHGVIHRLDGHGKVELSFVEENNVIIIDVSDNGIGRIQSQVHKRTSHKSQGMNIIKEKVDGLKAAGLAHVELEVTNFDNSNAKYPGTRVIISVKMNEDED